MLRSASDFGISHSDWNAAKAEAITAMVERAKLRGMSPYSDLVSKVAAVKFDASPLSSSRRGFCRGKCRRTRNAQRSGGA